MWNPHNKWPFQKRSGSHLTTRKLKKVFDLEFDFHLHAINSYIKPFQTGRPHFYRILAIEWRDWWRISHRDINEKQMAFLQIFTSQHYL